MNSSKKHKQPLISIVLVNWNGKKWLSDSLSCLLQQTYSNVEIILVDNGSTDDSVVYVKKNFPQVKIIKITSNIGFASGNNVGISASHGTYIVILNTDTRVEENFISQLYDYYISHSYAAIAPTEHRFDGSMNFPCNTTIDITGSPAYYVPRYSHPEKIFYLSGVCLFFSRDIYIETLGLDENFFMYFEETDWFWRLRLLGKTFHYVESIPVYHAGAGTTGNGIQYKAFLWRNQNVLQMLLKNYSGLTLVWILPIYVSLNIVEILFFLLTGRFSIAWTYMSGWLFNLKHIRRTWRMRAWVQTHRLISDREIMRKMFLGLGKWTALATYMKKTV